MDCERLEKRSVVAGFAIAFAICGLTLFGSMRGASHPNEVFNTVFWESYGWLGLAYLAVNAVVHAVLIARTGKIGWAVSHPLVALVWAGNQMLAAVGAPVFVMYELGFGAPAAICTNLVLATLAFAYSYRLTRAPHAPVVKVPDADWAAIEAEAAVARWGADPDGDLRERFAALERSGQ